MSPSSSKSAAAKTGAKALVESLERAGAEVVFGYPGGNVVDIFNHLAKAKFRFVLARHEQGAVHMADGYARATGRVGVVIVTSGPGATNAITGLATANVDGVPIVLVSGQVPLSEIGTDAFQEADMTGICRGATKHSFLVQRADEIPETVAEAFYIAKSGKPGAVVIDLPRNVQEERTSAGYPERISLRAYHPECAAAPGEVAALAKMLNAAKRPLVYAGGGVIASGAAEDLRRLVARAQIPVVTTLMGVGSVDERDGLSLGMAGIYGTPAAKRAVERSDLIVALGVRFSDRVTDGARPHRGARIVHVDCDASSIEKNVSVELGIVADVKDLLTTVLSRVRAARHAEWLAELSELRRLKPPPYERIHRGVIMPQEVIDAIAKATKGECLMVTDVGQHQMFAARRFPHARPRRFLTSGGMGTMGFGIPAAIGAALADTGEKVVAVLGDGGAQMTAEELLVASVEKLPVAFVVMNNRRLGMVDQLPECRYECNYTTPDFTLLARAYGIAATRVSDPAKLEGAVASAVRAKAPRLVEVLVDPAAAVA